VVSLNEERVILYPLPYKIKGFICADEDGSEVFVLNARLTREANMETMKHEIKHRKNNDLYCDCSVNELEAIRHK
jgi:hypothetical protein